MENLLELENVILIQVIQKDRLVNQIHEERLLVLQQIVGQMIVVTKMKMKKMMMNKNKSRHCLIQISSSFSVVRIRILDI